MFLKHLEKYHIDKTVLYVFLQRGWSSLSGLVTLYLLMNSLNKVELGYYYTFSSIIGIQMVFELGLTTVIRQFISHEHSLNNQPRLFYIIKKSLIAYSFIAISMMLFAGLFGFLFFDSSSRINWEYPWVMLVLFASLNCFMLVVTSSLEGMGYIEKIKKVQLLGVILSTFGIWIALYNNIGLFALGIVNCINFIVIFGYVFSKYRDIFIQSIKVNLVNSNVSWRKEIWPMQKNVAVSYLGGYFIFFIINPLAFKFYSPEFAGQLGVSFQIINLILALVASLINTKMPSFSAYIVKEKHMDLYNYYRKIVKSTVILFFILASGLLTLYFIFNYLDSKYINRVLPINLLILLLLMTFFRCLINCHACYIRTYKVELHKNNSIITAFCIVSFLFVTGYFFSSTWFVVSYALTVILISFPHSLYLTKKFIAENVKKYNYSHSNV